MATVTGLTAIRMLAIEAASIVSGLVDASSHLILTKQGGGQIDAGYVKGDTGPAGPQITGVVSMFAGAVAPVGSLLCNGQALSRSIEARLFAVIGTTFGVGDGTTTFNLPDLKGRIPAGLDSTQSEFNTLGKTGGEKTHLLSNAEMPSHTHTQNSHNHIQDAHAHGLSDPGHAHGFGAGQQSFGMWYGANAGGFVTFGVSVSNANGPSYQGPYSIASAATGIAVYNNTATNQVSTAVNQNTGGGGVHNNLQPYITLNYIIYT